ncbi:MAG: hypothetical protein AB1601_03820 [Planctomycetota bacterium]
MNAGREHETNWKEFEAAVSQLRRLHAECQRLLGEAEAIAFTRIGASTGRDAAAGRMSTFKNVPHLQVSRGLLLDGPGGPACRTFRLRGAERRVLAHLLLNDSIHVLEVIALQAKSGVGTFRDRKRHAQTTIAKLKATIRSLGLDIAKADGRRGDAWFFMRKGAAITFSVERAKAITERAVDDLKKGKPSSALLVAIDALACDDLVQEAHEVLCNAVVMAGTVGDQAAERIAKSTRHLASRVEQLRRGLQVCENSLASEDDDTVRAGLELQARKFTIERERIEKLVAVTNERFGPFGQGSPKDLRVNEAIQELRSSNLTFEQAWGHPLFTRVLGHPSVGWPLDEIVDQAKARDRDEQTALRDRVKAEILTLVLDPGARPNIRWICNSVKHLIPQILEAGDARRSPEARDAKKVDEAVDAFHKEHGFAPSMEVAEELEELSRLSGLSIVRLKAVADWKKAQRLKPLEALEWEQRKRTKRWSDDAYGDDDVDYPGDEDNDDGLAGTCVSG